ncbi:hypothetical protein Hanom_Chr01g00045051 [Helianthus anomalus]
MYSRKRSKTSREGSSSGVALAKWEQPCTLPDIEDRLLQNWDWSRFKDEEFGACWNENQNKPLCKFKNKKTEKKLWRYKMSKVTNPIDKVCVYERLVNAEDVTTRVSDISLSHLLRVDCLTVCLFVL